MEANFLQMTRLSRASKLAFEMRLRFALVWADALGARYKLASASVTYAQDQTSNLSNFFTTESRAF